MRPADESDGDKRYALRFLTTEEVISDYALVDSDARGLQKNAPASRCLGLYGGSESEFRSPSCWGFEPTRSPAFASASIPSPQSISFLEREADLDKVLQIFIRTNSGGTKLSYSDLLLSIATASWTQLNARQKIHGLVDELCSYGDELTVDRDFVLKACLVLGDIGDVKFKVTNFTRENITKIEQKWLSIRNAST